MEQENDRDETDDHTFGDQVALQRSDGFANQARAVVACMDLNSGGQGGCDLSNPCLNSVDHVQGVLARAHHNDAAYGFSLALPFRHAFANIWSKCHRAEVAQEHRRAIFCIYGHFLQVLERSQISQASDHVTRAIHLQHPSTDFIGAGANPINDGGKRNAIGQQLVWVKLHLILLDEPAYCCNFCHSGYRFQLVAYLPVLYRT